ncbi:MAG: hypothetical protein IIU85_02475 [Rikenellaceae bacterium]|nr:hypothetical protein [Rikenellaceae bacterium]
MKQLFSRMQAFAQLLLGLLVIILTTSCEDNNDSPLMNTETVMVYDLSGNTDYPISIFNAANSTVTMIETTDTGVISGFNHISFNDQPTFKATFDENGLLNGIGTEGVTIAFSNYNGNKVDIAVMLGDDTFLIKEFESPNDWSKIDGPLFLNMPSDISRSEPSSTEKLWEVWSFIGDQFKNLGELVLDGIQSSQGIQSAKKAGLKYLFNVVKDGALFVADLNREMEYSIFFAELASWAAASPTTPWGALWLLLSNYYTYEHFVEDNVYALLEMYDQFFNDRDNGLGAINSGFGALKATLTWNFYADIDLHAYEPNGTHIYWDNPRSSSTGAYLDVDNRKGGSGAIENIYWKKIENGVYTIYIDYYGESILNDRCDIGTCTISVFFNGRGKTFKITPQPEQHYLVTNLSFPNGTFIDSESRALDIQVVLNSKSKPKN